MMFPVVNARSPEALKKQIFIYLDQPPSKYAYIALTEGGDQQLFDRSKTYELSRGLVGRNKDGYEFDDRIFWRQVFDFIGLKNVVILLVGGKGNIQRYFSGKVKDEQYIFACDRDHRVDYPDCVYHTKHYSWESDVLNSEVLSEYVDSELDGVSSKKDKDKLYAVFEKNRYQFKNMNYPEFLKFVIKQLETDNVLLEHYQQRKQHHQTWLKQQGATPCHSV